MDDLFRATKAIAAEFEARELKFCTERTDETSYVETGFNTDRAGVIKILFLSSDDDNDVAARAYNVIRGIPEDRRDQVLKTVNVCNRRFRYVRFSMDDDGSIDAEYDFPQCAEPVGEMAFEIAVRFTQVIDEAYPLLMKAIWG